MSYPRGIATVGVRESRQSASEILRDVEAGEPATAQAHGARLVTANVIDVGHLSELIDIVP